MASSRIIIVLWYLRTHFLWRFRPEFVNSVVYFTLWWSLWPHLWPDVTLWALLPCWYWSWSAAPVGNDRVGKTCAQIKTRFPKKSSTKNNIDGFVQHCSTLQYVSNGVTVVLHKATQMSLQNQLALRYSLITIRFRRTAVIEYQILYRFIYIYIPL